MRARSINVPLVKLVAIPPESVIDVGVTQVIKRDDFFVFPKTAGVYPLKRIDQIQLYWYLTTMPHAATLVEITPVAFRGFLDDTSVATAAQFNTGWIVKATQIFEWYEFQFDQLNNATSDVTPHQFAYKKTAADPTLSFNGQTYNRGTRHSLPIADDYIGFYLHHDGDNDTTGAQVLSAQLTWC